MTEGNLYQALNLQKDADSRQIRKAYKRLALKYHPDKNGGNDDMFREVERAYNILSNYRKRKMYDKYGEKGLVLLQAYGEGILVDLVSEDINLYTIFGMSSLICALLITQLVILILKLRGPIFSNEHWALIFVPTWLLNLVICYCYYEYSVICSITIPEPKDEEEGNCDDVETEEKRSNLDFVALVSRYLLIFLFQVMVTLKMQDSLTYAMNLYYVPYVGYEVVVITEKIYSYLQLMELFKASKMSSSMKQTFASYMFALFEYFKYAIVRVLFAVLLLLRIEAKLNFSWWIVFFPILLGGIAVPTIDVVCDYLQLKNAQTEDDASSIVNGMILKVISSICVALFLYPTVILTTLILEGSSLDILFACIPALIILGILLLCCCCCVPLLVRPGNEEEDPVANLILMYNTVYPKRKAIGWKSSEMQVQRSSSSRGKHVNLANLVNDVGTLKDSNVSRKKSTTQATRVAGSNPLPETPSRKAIERPKREGSSKPTQRRPLPIIDDSTSSSCSSDVPVAPKPPKLPSPRIATSEPSHEIMRPKPVKAVSSTKPPQNFADDLKRALNSQKAAVSTIDSEAKPEELKRTLSMKKAPPVPSRPPKQNHE